MAATCQDTRASETILPSALAAHGRADPQPAARGCQRWRTGCLQGDPAGGPLPGRHDRPGRLWCRQGPPINSLANSVTAVTRLSIGPMGGSKRASPPQFPDPLLALSDHCPLVANMEL